MEPSDWQPGNEEESLSTGHHSATETSWFPILTDALSEPESVGHRLQTARMAGNESFSYGTRRTTAAPL